MANSLGLSQSQGLSDRRTTSCWGISGLRLEYVMQQAKGFWRSPVRISGPLPTEAAEGRALIFISHVWYPSDRESVALDLHAQAKAEALADYVTAGAALQGTRLRELPHFLLDEEEWQKRRQRSNPLDAWRSWLAWVDKECGHAHSSSTMLDLSITVSMAGLFETSASSVGSDIAVTPIRTTKAALDACSTFLTLISSPDHFRRLWCVWEWAAFLARAAPHYNYIKMTFVESLTSEDEFQAFVEAVSDFSLDSLRCSSKTDYQDVWCELHRVIVSTKGFEGFMRSTVLGCLARNILLRCTSDGAFNTSTEMLDTIHQAATQCRHEKLAAALKQAKPKLWWRSAFSAAQAKMRSGGDETTSSEGSVDKSPCADTLGVPRPSGGSELFLSPSPSVLPDANESDPLQRFEWSGRPAADPPGPLQAAAETAMRLLRGEMDSGSEDGDGQESVVRGDGDDAGRRRLRRSPSRSGLPEGYRQFWAGVHGHGLNERDRVRARLFHRAWGIYKAKVDKWFNISVVPMLEIWRQRGIRSHGVIEEAFGHLFRPVEGQLQELLCTALAPGLREEMLAKESAFEQRPDPSPWAPWENATLDRLLICSQDQSICGPGQPEDAALTPAILASPLPLDQTGPVDHMLLSVQAAFQDGELLSSVVPQRLGADALANLAKQLLREPREARVEALVPRMALLVRGAGAAGVAVIGCRAGGMLKVLVPEELHCSSMDGFQTQEEVSVEDPGYVWKPHWKGWKHNNRVLRPLQAQPLHDEIGHEVTTPERKIPVNLHCPGRAQVLSEPEAEPESVALSPKRKLGGPRRSPGAQTCLSDHSGPPHPGGWPHPGRGWHRRRFVGPGGLLPPCAAAQAAKFANPLQLFTSQTPKSDLLGFTRNRRRRSPRTPRPAAEEESEMLSADEEDEEEKEEKEEMPAPLVPRPPPEQIPSLLLQGFQWHPQCDGLPRDDEVLWQGRLEEIFETLLAMVRTTAFSQWVPLDHLATAVGRDLLGFSLVRGLKMERPSLPARVSSKRRCTFFSRESIAHSKAISTQNIAGGGPVELQHPLHLGPTCPTCGRCDCAKVSLQDSMLGHVWAAPACLVCLSCGHSEPLHGEEADSIVATALDGESILEVTTALYLGPGSTASVQRLIRRILRAEIGIVSVALVREQHSAAKSRVVHVSFCSSAAVLCAAAAVGKRWKSASGDQEPVAGPFGRDRAWIGTCLQEVGLDALYDEARDIDTNVAIEELDDQQMLPLRSNVSPLVLWLELSYVLSSEYDLAKWCAALAQVIGSLPLTPAIIMRQNVDRLRRALGLEQQDCKRTIECEPQWPLALHRVLTTHHAEEALLQLALSGSDVTIGGPAQLRTQGITWLRNWKDHAPNLLGKHVDAKTIVRELAVWRLDPTATSRQQIRAAQRTKRVLQRMQASSYLTQLHAAVMQSDHWACTGEEKLSDDENEDEDEKEEEQNLERDSSESADPDEADFEAREQEERAEELTLQKVLGHARTYVDYGDIVIKALQVLSSVLKSASHFSPSIEMRNFNSKSSSTSDHFLKVALLMLNYGYITTAFRALHRHVQRPAVVQEAVAMICVLLKSRAAEVGPRTLHEISFPPERPLTLIRVAGPTNDGGHLEALESLLQVIEAIFTSTVTEGRDGNPGLPPELPRGRESEAAQILVRIFREQTDRQEIFQKTLAIVKGLLRHEVMCLCLFEHGLAAEARSFLSRCAEGDITRAWKGMDHLAGHMARNKLSRNEVRDRLKACEQDAWGVLVTICLATMEQKATVERGSRKAHSRYEEDSGHTVEQALQELRRDPRGSQWSHALRALEVMLLADRATHAMRFAKGGGLQLLLEELPHGEVREALPLLRAAVDAIGPVPPAPEGPMESDDDDIEVSTLKGSKSVMPGRPSVPEGKSTVSQEFQAPPEKPLIRFASVPAALDRRRFLEAQAKTQEIALLTDSAVILTRQARQWLAQNNSVSRLLQSIQRFKLDASVLVGLLRVLGQLVQDSDSGAAQSSTFFDEYSSPDKLGGLPAVFVVLRKHLGNKEVVGAALHSLAGVIQAKEGVAAKVPQLEDGTHCLIELVWKHIQVKTIRRRALDVLRRVLASAQAPTVKGMRLWWEGEFQKHTVKHTPALAKAGSTSPRSNAAGDQSPGAKRSGGLMMLPTISDRPGEELELTTRGRSPSPEEPPDSNEASPSPSPSPSMLRATPAVRISTLDLPSARPASFAGDSEERLSSKRFSLSLPGEQPLVSSGSLVSSPSLPPSSSLKPSKSALASSASFANKPKRAVSISAENIETVILPATEESPANSDDDEPKFKKKKKKKGKVPKDMRHFAALLIVNDFRHSRSEDDVEAVVNHMVDFNQDEDLVLMALEGLMVGTANVMLDRFMVIAEAVPTAKTLRRMVMLNPAEEKQNLFMRFATGLLASDTEPEDKEDLVEVCSISISKLLDSVEFWAALDWEALLAAVDIVIQQESGKAHCVRLEVGLQMEEAWEKILAKHDAAGRVLVKNFKEETERLLRLLA